MRKEKISQILVGSGENVEKVVKGKVDGYEYVQSTL